MGIWVDQTARPDLQTTGEQTLAEAHVQWLACPGRQPRTMCGGTGLRTAHPYRHGQLNEGELAQHGSVQITWFQAGLCALCYGDEVRYPTIIMVGREQADPTQAG